MENRYNNNLIDCSFLQVTINSNKLMQILQQLNKQTIQHSNQIKILRQVIPTIKQSVITSLQSTEARVKLQTQRSALKLRQQMNFIKAHVNSVDQQISKIGIGMEKQIKDKGKEIQFLVQEKKRIQGTIKIYEENRMEFNKKINEEIYGIKEEIVGLDREIKEADLRADDKFQLMYLKMQSIIKKNGLSTRSHDNSGQKKFRNTSTIISKNKQYGNSQSSLTNWAMFSTKISQIQKKCEQKQNTMPILNKVMYSTKSAMQERQKQHEDSNNSIMIDNNGFQLNYDQIQEIFIKLNEQNQDMINSFRNKLIIQQEKADINSRKIQKIMQLQNQMKYNMKKIEQKRGEDYHIDLLRNQIKKLNIEINEELQKKMNKQNYEKQKLKLLQKISIIQENITEKADKGDMKKAFLFMEDKIKQLIILIASDQTEQKDGAIRKIPAKCLSCDKGLQTQNMPIPPVTSRLTSPRENQANLRTITRKIRSRMHTSNQNSTTNL